MILRKQGFMAVLIAVLLLYYSSNLCWPVVVAAASSQTTQSTTKGATSSSAGSTSTTTPPNWTLKYLEKMDGIKKSNEQKVTQSRAASTATYLPQMQKFYTFDTSQIDKIGWFITLAGVAGTLVSIALFFYWLYKLFEFLIKVRMAKEDMRNTRFWKRMFISLMLLICFMCGAALMIASQLYDLSVGWGGSLF
ncbi:hypothetical protein [Paenibacillus polymyxa]|uniref:hypothetical protein n=1 Tax=Paenibacillus polymyxa TaxID=1406 RepID=UPI0025B71621|nr:hypothetical protein [Paenibacillus polymyxa]MDN4090895.1 hypothetical protein [Paenibacillus polymyxa]